MKTFVHATEPVGWFVFENLPAAIAPSLIAPKYSTGDTKTGDSVAGQDLRRLGYQQGTINEETNQISYHQEGWNGFSYDVNVRWQQKEIRFVVFGV